LRRLVEAFEQEPGAGTLAAALIEAHTKERNLKSVADVYRAFYNHSQTSHERDVERALGSALSLVPEDPDDLLLLVRIAGESIGRLEQIADKSEQTLRALEQAALAQKPEVIHELLEGRNELVLQEPALLLALAFAKIALAKSSTLDARDGRFDDEAKRRLWGGARDLLRRVVQMDASAGQHRRAWQLLTQALEALQAPESEIAAARKEAEASIGPS
jgi:hypothetical protein